MEMFGSGVKIIIVVLLKAMKIRRDLILALTALCGAVPGTTLRGACARPIASTFRLGLVTPIWVSAW